MFVIDCEAVFCPDDGVPDFDRLISRRVDADVFAYGFDLLALDGDDLRPLLLERRKAMLAQVLAQSRDGIVMTEHMAGEHGPMLFEHACRTGLEGIVSKRRDRPYQAGRSRYWIKIKNPASPAARRIEEGA